MSDLDNRDNEPLKASYDPKLQNALMHPSFPEIDSNLRRGYHISSDDLLNHLYIQDFFEPLKKFYARYNVELVRAPEMFFYLRPKSTTLIRSSVLSELEMLVGKILCYMFLSPERLAQQGIFSYSDVYEELSSLVDIKRLVKIVGQRRQGTDLDLIKFKEKLNSSLNRMKTMGVISSISKERFVIHQSCFRFGADVRTNKDPLQAQLDLIISGEGTNQEALELEDHARNAGIDFDKLYRKDLTQAELEEYLARNPDPKVVTHLESLKDNLEVVPTETNQEEITIDDAEQDYDPNLELDEEDQEDFIIEELSDIPDDDYQEEDKN